MENRIDLFRRFTLGCAIALTPLPGIAQQHPRDAEIHDPDTLASWHTTEDLSNDSMQGRDTGTAAYQRAAEYVAKRFEAAGLKPAGLNGTYFQTVPMHEVDVLPAGTRFTVHYGDRAAVPLSFLHEITVGASATLPPKVEGELVFRGYCGKDAMMDVADKVVMCFGTQRTGLPGAAERAANAREAGAVALLTVDDPYFTLEPPRWPYAYARAVTLRDMGPQPKPINRRGNPPPVTMRCSVEAFRKLLAGTGHDADAVLKVGGAKQSLENFDLPGRTLEVDIQTAEKDISSPNVLAVLPGSDPALRDQYVVVAAHLDGYGFGTPVNGDNLYNGTLDDAAYVALLIQMADDLQQGKDLQPDASPREKVGQLVTHGAMLSPPKRSILFCAFTGEEKGLLGSTWFVEHPTVPIANLAADINLDQLRPLFPLKILTALAIHDTTLGATATQVGSADGIQLREDREPERGLLRRADHYPFLKAGVPAIGFVFGFDPGTDAEKRYRHWYEVQYHRPQDDLTQPVDFDAAAKFDNFFYRLVETVADDPERPRILPGSPFAQAQ